MRPVPSWPSGRTIFLIVYFILLRFHEAGPVSVAAGCKGGAAAVVEYCTIPNDPAVFVAEIYQRCSR